jgi:HAD superfamily hydrolase (TIGR01450 family)
MDYSQFDAILLDLDGTIYSEEHALPGAVQLVAQLNAGGRKFACLSNSTLSPAGIAQRLLRMGISITPEHIYSAAAAAADYVLDRYKSPRRIYNLATDGMVELLDRHVDWVETPEQECDAVVVGAPANVYATEARQRVALMLLRAGADLVGICPDRIFPSPRGLEFGVGAHCAMLAYAANCSPVFVGKPQEMFFHKLCERLSVDPRRCVLVGDNPESDIAGAKRVGMTTVLTLTGITRREDIQRLAPKDRPDDVVEDLRELVGKV